MASSTWRRARWCLAILLCISRQVGSEPNCLIEEKVCYQGTNIAVDFSDVGSSHQGCREVQNERECCQLCAQYWPQCLSWQYIREGTVDNGYPGMNSFCCLKDELAPDPVAADFCDSGYQNPKCFLTSPCVVELTGSSLSISNSILAILPGESCGSAKAAAAGWPGIANPQTPSLLEASTAEFDLGRAPNGTAGIYLLCYSVNGGSVQDHSTIVGLFNMRGPDEGQSLSCTLGQLCAPTMSGVDLPVVGDGAKYKVVIVEDHGVANPCGSGAVFADIDGLQNPDNVEDNEFDDTFRMETPTAGSTLASYAMCFANDPSDDIADFTHRVGSFRLIGPEAGPQSCVMGRPCEFAVLGTGLSTGMALMLIFGDNELFCAGLVEGDVVQLGSSLVNPARPFSAVPDVGGAANFSFGVAERAHLNNPGSRYRLCFSAAPAQEPPAYDLGDYSVDVGTFTLYGPVFEDASCAFTLPCRITISGAGLDALAWGLVIVGDGEQCGSPGAGANISGGSWINPASGDSSGTASFGTATFGIASNTYSACWGAYPSSLADYNVTLGTFAMHGPATLTGTTCTKGLECVIDLSCPAGLSSCGLAFTNRMILLSAGSSCGDRDAMEASFSPMATEKVVNNDGLYFRYELGFPDVGTAQEGYIMCWGADPTEIANYSFTLGDLFITGANPVDMSCTLGLECRLQVSGISLASTNRIIVLGSGSCGQGENNIRYADLDGLITSQQVADADPYDAYALSVPVAGVPGTGLYKVCWASAPGDTGGTNLYRVQAGSLTINGPVQAAHACTLGVDCTIDLPGTGLDASNKVMIIHSSSSCGDASPTLAEFEGFQNPQFAQTDNPSLFDMGIAGTTSGGVGSDYTICWAHDPSSLADYKVQVGTFSMYGPDPEGLLQCTMGVSCTLEFTSTVNLASTNQIIITALSDTCGQANLDATSFVGFANPAGVGTTYNLFPLGLATFGLPGDYKICWAHEPDGSEADFNVEVGTFRMNGPTPEDKQCILSEPCQVSARGVGLSVFSAVIVVSEADSCGQADATIISWTGIVNPSAKLGSETYYDAGIGSAGMPGVYRICWGTLPANGGPELYNVHVGLFTMAGPYAGKFLTCTLGRPCNLEISGFLLSGTNSLRILADVSQCGDAGKLPADLQGIKNPKGVTDDESDVLYGMGTVTSGGSYGSCRTSSPAASCIGSHYRLCWAHGETPLDNGELNHLVDIGTFALSGPYGDYAIECFIGRMCAFTLYGSELRRTNQVLVVEKRSHCGDASPEVVKLLGVRNPMVATDVALASEVFRLGRPTGGRLGEFRLCWGGDPRVPRHFNVEIGPFHLRETPDGCEAADKGLALACSPT